MSALRFWQTLACFLAVLCLWQGFFHGEEHRGSPSESPRAAPGVTVVRSGQDVPASSEPEVASAEPAASEARAVGVYVPADAAVRLAKALRSPLKGSPPEPMHWDRDHMLLLGFKPQQVDAMDAAAERARQKAIAVLKRIVRPATAEEVQRLNRAASVEGSFYIPAWKEEGKQLVSEFREELRQIAGEAADEFLPGDGGLGMNGDGERLISFEDSEARGWTVRLSEQTFSYQSTANLYQGEELPDYLREIFKVEENQQPAQDAQIPRGP